MVSLTGHLTTIVLTFLNLKKPILYTKMFQNFDIRNTLTSFSPFINSINHFDN